MHRAHGHPFKSRPACRVLILPQEREE
jgi:hypothetical protein